MPIQVVDVRARYAADATTRTLKALICGPPGVGKTLFASTAPNALYADLEGRLLSVRDRPVRAATIESVQDLEELKMMLDQPAEVRTKVLGGLVETVVIDTVDELARLIIRERLRAEKVEAMRMQDWGYLADNLRSILRGFRNIRDLNVIFLCHDKDVTDSETGRVEKKPDIQGAVGNEIAAYVDESWAMVARPVVDPSTGDRVIRRYMQTYPDLQHTWVKDHSGRMPGEFICNFADDFERIRTVIFGDSTQVQPAPAKAAGKAVSERPPARKVRDRETVPPTVDVPLPEGDIAATATPAPPAPAPEPTPAPAPEPAPEPEPQPAAQDDPGVSPAVASDETESSEEVAPVTEGGVRCAKCGDVIDDPDIAEISEIRYGEYLCRKDFKARKEGRT